MDIVLCKDGDHGMRCPSTVVGWQSHPQAQKALVSYGFSKTVENILVRKFSFLIYIAMNILLFILRIFVFMLSKGRDPTEATTPDIADPKSLINVVS